MTRPRGAPPREVRLIGGRFKRSKLPVADRPGLRPTPDRVRETLFNWLGQDLSGWRVLDAFAGSGALGFEAASRGAAEAVLVERDAALIDSLRRSAQRLGAAQVQVVAADALTWMARCGPARFDLVFIDPPFDAGLSAPALAAAGPLLRAGGVVYLEASQAFVPAPGWVLRRHARAGAVHAHLLQPASYTDPDPDRRSAP
ncbi:16S rRNA (guanine(966)-N(2))-methyltransferase RsmD [Azohydromonas sp.]|uniref:16S rRNA (guanine(966)-N(2))-methyltransferase RsmD n=1 Tax=Azohydromonas sp. TaxID=1872666 RepID=UPI002B8E3619|nr:16S rRNA (guanine(966)-N(2))-methyltransferase RsmD [Azohydromonas sp.]HMM85627.1 16S rRNA (guanine(966)-N(2))-methyltransferase RsmD [Azohydromonas sp.]